MYFEFKKLKFPGTIVGYKYWFIFWFTVGVLPSANGYNRVYHIGINYYSFFIGLGLNKLVALGIILFLACELLPTVGDHGWKHWLFSLKLSKIVISILNVDVFGELTGHSGFYNVKESLQFRLEQNGLDISSFDGFLSNMKVFSKDLFLYA